VRAILFNRLFTTSLTNHFRDQSDREDTFDFLDSLPTHRKRDARPYAAAMEGMTALRSIAILLHPGRAQPGKAETIDRMLPGEEFLHRQRIALTGVV